MRRVLALTILVSAVFVFSAPNAQAAACCDKKVGSCTGAEFMSVPNMSGARNQPAAAARASTRPLSAVRRRGPAVVKNIPPRSRKPAKNWLEAARPATLIASRRRKTATPVGRKTRTATARRTAPKNAVSKPARQNRPALRKKKRPHPFRRLPIRSARCSSPNSSAALPTPFSASPAQSRF